MVSFESSGEIKYLNIATLTVKSNRLDIVAMAAKLNCVDIVPLVAKSNPHSCGSTHQYKL